MHFPWELRGRVSGRAAGRGEPGGGSLGSAEPPRLRGAPGPSGNSPSLDTKIKHCVAMGLKEKRRGIVRERLCLAARAVPAAAFRENCGAVGRAGGQRGGHDGKRARLGELSLTDEGLIFIWFRSVSFINVRRGGSLEQIRREKEQALKSVLFAFLSGC